jgi:SSS family solute:Na+ symporter
VPAVAAKLALLTGLLAIGLGYFVFGVGQPGFPMHTFHFLGVVFAGLVLLMLILGMLLPRSEPWVQRESGLVDMTPWRGAKPVGFGLIVVVLLIYLAFADTSVL